MEKPLCLIIRDGWGYAPRHDNNGIFLAHPKFDIAMEHDDPTTMIKASGLAVGLPEGTMGNSEVGQATNQYHCVRASVRNTLVRDGEWDFMFIASTPTNGIPYSWPVAVDFNGTVITNLSVIL